MVSDQSDSIGAQLSMLEVKRDRTMTELDAVQAAGQSVIKSMNNFQTRQEQLNERYLTQLEADGLPEKERLALYRQWNDAFKQNTDEFNELAAERERLHMQEVILVRMLTELDYQIKTLKEQFS